MALNPVSTTYVKGEDLSWLRSAFGTEHGGLSITLDATLFTSTPFPGLIVKSGTVLGKVTSGGKYGPYKSDASDGTQFPYGVLLATVDLTDGGLIAAGADQPASLMLRGVLISSKMPQGTGSSATTPGALDSAATTYPADLTAVSAGESAVIAFLSRFLVVAS